ncbi:hypothetical protein G5I_11883 [Acromyrmex echinatior]|uniref:Uncharacterized protein n=1 Tax=Acromyrmex echinatior TaxID=103372 RepID=F4X0T5_ACREC|nr:hypothetical protein G5I_11883 [Acromyrmex echinatior]
MRGLIPAVPRPEAAVDACKRDGRTWGANSALYGLPRRGMLPAHNDASALASVSLCRWVFLEVWLTYATLAEQLTRCSRGGVPSEVGYRVGSSLAMRVTPHVWACWPPQRLWRGRRFRDSNRPWDATPQVALPAAMPLRSESRKPPSREPEACTLSRPVMSLGRTRPAGGAAAGSGIKQKLNEQFFYIVRAKGLSCVGLDEEEKEAEGARAGRDCDPASESPTKGEENVNMEVKTKEASIFMKVEWGHRSLYTPRSSQRRKRTKSFVLSDGERPGLSKKSTSGRRGRPPLNPSQEDQLMKEKRESERESARAKRLLKNTVFIAEPTRSPSSKKNEKRLNDIENLSMEFAQQPPGIVSQAYEAIESIVKFIKKFKNIKSDIVDHLWTPRAGPMYCSASCPTFTVLGCKMCIYAVLAGLLYETPAWKTEARISAQIQHAAPGPETFCSQSEMKEAEIPDTWGPPCSIKRVSPVTSSLITLGVGVGARTGTRSLTLHSHNIQKGRCPLLACRAETLANERRRPCHGTCRSTGFEASQKNAASVPEAP